MQSLIIRNADINDLDAVTKLESRCFPIAEAADRKAFECRLRNYSECFWVLEKDDSSPFPSAVFSGHIPRQTKRCFRGY